jgi:PBSX family phage terminase large subunit
MFINEAPKNGELAMIGKTIQTLARNVIAPLRSAEIFGPLARETQYVMGAPQAVILGRPVHIIGAADARSEEKIRGLTGAGFYVDEATLIPELVWNQVLTRMSVPGSKLFATTNPDNPYHWLRTNFILGGDHRTRTFKFRLPDNPSLEPEYIDWLKTQFHGLFYRRFIDGDWVAAEGAIYDMLDHDVHVVDIIPAISQWLCVGIDYGTSNPFHALLLGLTITGELYVCAEWRYHGRKAQRQLTDAQYADKLREWLARDPVGPRYGAIDPHWWIVDPSAASFRTELKTRGVRQYEADNSVLDGIRLVSSLLGGNKLRIHRSCEHLINEMSGYSWDDSLALMGKDAPLKENDHGPDALRYAVKTTEAIWRPRLAA